MSEPASKNHQNWQRASIAELASALRSGLLSSQELTSAAIHRIRVLNPSMNAMVKSRFASALHEAELADQRLRDESPERLPPLLGIPFSAKECFAIEGMPNASGLASRKSLRSKGDAEVFRRLRAQGGIVLGVSNTSELCMWMESSNSLYGRSNNPYDPRWIVGGSSGGEAALVASGCVPFGVGSDIGGSIRMPAFFNGVFGHKPSPGLVPNQGQYPNAANGGQRLLSTGPICRRADDLWPLLELLSARCDMPGPSRVSLQGLRVLNVRSNHLEAPHPSLELAQDMARRALQSRGALLCEADFPSLSDSFVIWSSRMGASGGASFAQLMGDGRSLPAVLELLRWTVGRSKHTFPAIALALLEKGSWLPAQQVRRQIELGARLQAEIEAELAGGVMLFPSYPQPAPMHHRPMASPFAWLYTAIINALELAATQVPLGLDVEGRPLGVQVIAARGNDHLCVAVALELERALGGWVVPATAA